MKATHLYAHLLAQIQESAALGGAGAAMASVADKMMDRLRVLSLDMRHANGDVVEVQRVSDSNFPVITTLMKEMSRKEIKALAPALLARIREFFVGEQQAALISELASATCELGRTWAMQNFQPVLQYFLAEEWEDEWQYQGASEASLRNMLFNKARALGCDTPSEPTTKLWNATLRFRLCGKAAALALTEYRLKEQHVDLKKQWKKFRSQTILPTEDGKVVTHLPQWPHEFQREYPKLWTSVFGDKHPVICPIDIRTIFDINSTACCRGAVSSSVSATRQAIYCASVNDPRQSNDPSVGNGAQMHTYGNIVDKMQKTMTEAMQAMQKQHFDVLRDIVRRPHLQLMDSQDTSADEKQPATPKASLLRRSPSGISVESSQTFTPPHEGSKLLQGTLGSESAERAAQRHAAAEAEHDNPLSILKARDASRKRRRLAADDNDLEDKEDEYDTDNLGVKKRPASKAVATKQTKRSKTVDAPKVAALKRPAAAPKASVTGSNTDIIVLDARAEKLPAGWKVWKKTDGRLDKYYQSPDGTRFCSRVKVNEFLGI